MSEYEFEDIAKKAADSRKTGNAQFVRSLRKDAWQQVFKMFEFDKWLDSKQTDSLLRDIMAGNTVDFTAENIKSTARNIFAQREALIARSAANVFDELCRHHADNGLHSEGWKTNSNYKVNKRLIFPWGCKWCEIFGTFDRYGDRDAMRVYRDLDRVVCHVSGEKFEQIMTVGQALEQQWRYMADNNLSDDPSEKKCDSTFFKIKFYKKGTVHLEWRDLKLLEEFNKLAAKGRTDLGHETKQAA